MIEQYMNKQESLKRKKKKTFHCPGLSHKLNLSVVHTATERRLGPACVVRS